MSRSKTLAILIGLLLFIPTRQSARAAVETIPSSTVPPPPGELRFIYVNPPPPSSNRADLHFLGSARSSSSALTTITWRFDWTLPSGDLAYSSPIIFDLEPGKSSVVESSITVAGCPNNVGLVFTTQSTLGATVSGTFDHACAIPEPRSVAMFAVFTAYSTLSPRRPRVM